MSVMNTTIAKHVERLVRGDAASYAGAASPASRT